jgi:hypothetical protein
MRYLWFTYRKNKNHEPHEKHELSLWRPSLHLYRRFVCGKRGSGTGRKGRARSKAPPFVLVRVIEPEVRRG